MILTSFDDYNIKRGDQAMPDHRVMVVEDADNAALTDAQRFMLDYFEAKTGRARLANRADLVPADLVPYLPHLALLDLIRDANGNFIDFRGRLVGTAVAEFYGDLTNKGLDAIAPKETRDRLIAAVETIDEVRKPLATYSERKTGTGSKVGVHVLFLPLSSDGVIIDKLFLFFEMTF
jgi:hypothetical protein